MGNENNKSIKEIDRIKSFPLPLNILFEEEVISYSEYEVEKYKFPKKLISNYAGKEGYLAAGDLILADIKMSNKKNNLDFTICNLREDITQGLLSKANFKISIEMPSFNITIDEAVSLKDGSIIYSDVDYSEKLIVYSDDTPFARGEAGVIDDSLGVVITDLIEAGEQNDVSKIDNCSIKIRPVFSKTECSLGDLLTIQTNSIIESDTLSGDPVEIKILNKIYYTDVLVIDDKFAFRVRKDFSKDIAKNNLKETQMLSEKVQVLENSISTLKKNFFCDQNENNEVLKGPEKFFELLNSYEPGVLINYLALEHPQTIAFVFSCLNPDKASYLIGALPDDLKTEVIRRMAVMNTVDSSIIPELYNYIESKFENASDSFSGLLTGIDGVTGLFSFFDRATELKIIEDLEKTDAELVEELKNRLLIFEDIMFMDDRSIQRFLREVDVNYLAKALKGTDEEIKERIFRNMSKRASALLLEDMDFMGDLSKNMINDAKEFLEDTMRTLYNQGEILIIRE